jgi:signal peptidase II
MKETLLRKGKISLFFFFLLSCDLLTKYYTYLFIPKMSYLHPFYPYGGIGIFRDFFGVTFSINYIQNVGAAWGLFSSFPHLLFAIRIVIVVGLLVYIFFFNSHKKRDLPLFFIFTGALGNIMDTILYGHVVDMIHFTFGHYSFPVFNLADMMISLGIIWLFILSFRCNCKKKESHD